MNLSSPARVKIRNELNNPIVGIDPQPYSFNPRHRIRFRHPHYSPPNNILLDLCALDGTDGGLEFGFAHTACSLISGNRADGYFTSKIDGTALSFTHGDVMVLKDYYFQIPNSTRENPYPIVPTFRDWRYPHDDLPPLWFDSIQPPSRLSTRSYAPSNFSGAILAQNTSCRISDYIEATEAAHLCPRSELHWSRQNEMFQYNTDPTLPPDRLLDDTANALLLRQDIHVLFDTGKFVFIPKKGADAAESINIVSHVLVPIQELGLLYHNVRLKPVSNIHPAFLLARFAWVIFRFVEKFMTAGVERNVLSVDGLSKWISGNECKELISRTRNQSSKKKSKRLFSDHEDGNLSDCETGQQNSKKIRQNTFLRDSGIEIVKSPLGSPDTPAESEEEFQASQTPPSQSMALRQAWLKNERQRSDPRGTWGEEQAWVESVWDNKVVMGADEAKRFWEFHGMETQE